MHLRLVLNISVPCCSKVFQIVTHKYFDVGILFFILVSSVELALDEPRANPASGVKVALVYLDYILGIVFAVEMGLKLIAYGLVLHKVSKRLVVGVVGVVWTRVWII